MQIAQAAPVIGDTVVQVADNLSRLNHRQYRQGMTYTVKVDLEPTSTQTVDVYALNPTWLLKSAWGLAYKTWLNATDAERQAARKAGIAAKWGDFRIEHALDSVGEGLPLIYNRNRSSQLLSSGEFVASKVEDGTSITGWKGFAIDSVPSLPTVYFDIFAEFGQVYRPNESTPSAAVKTVVPYTTLDSADEDLSDVEYNEAQDAGNLPPYSQSVETHQWIKVAQLRSGTSAATGRHARLSTGFFDAPLGFIVLENYAPSDADSSDCIVEVKAGSYRGVAATPMGVAKKTAKMGWTVK